MRVGYLLGTSYCGSTMAAILADTHPEIVSVGETAPNRRIQRRNGEGFRCSCGEPLPSCPYWNALFEEVQRQGHLFSADHWTNDFRYHNSILNRLFDAESDSRFRRIAQEVLRSLVPMHRNKMASVGRVNVAFVTAALRIGRGSVFFDTSKSISRLRNLMAVPDFDVRVVHLVRDVRAYVRSKRKAIPNFSAASAAEEWRTFQESAERLLHQRAQVPHLTIRYEDLTSNPVASMMRLHSLLGVEAVQPPDELDPTEHHVIGNKIRLGGKMRIRCNEIWQDELSEADQEAALRVAGDLNRSYGYPT